MWRIISCTAFYPTLSDEDYGKLTKGEDGFEKIEKKYGFFCYESRIFSLGGFMDALAEGKLKADKVPSDEGTGDNGR